MIIDIHNENIEDRKKSISKWKIPPSEKKELLRFIEELELGKVNKGKKISKRRQMKYITLLKTPLNFWNKELEKLTIKDVETYEKALTTNDKKLKKRTKKEYSQETKKDIRTALKVYIKWRLGENKAVELSGWLDTRRIKRTPDYLKESEIDSLYKSCKSAKERFAIAVLFDTGARASEFFNIRHEDINLQDNKDGFFQITLKEEYSKTEGRTISLYWKRSLEAVRDYIKEREKEGIKRNDAVYKGSYDSLRFFLKRLGKKIIKKRVYLHLFRHSSATYYSSKLNRQQLCYRYGWKFSSNMPDIYISRAGMNNKELDEKFTSTKMEEFETNLEKERQINKIKQEEFEIEISSLSKDFENYIPLLKAIKSNPKVIQLLSKEMKR